MEARMRVLCGVLAVVLVLFAAVQYNDPDALLWAGMYGTGALWCGFAAFSPKTLDWRPARLMLLATVGLMAWGLVAFWPDAERWWSIDVWWPEVTGETSREGMGMMILFAAVLAAAAAALRRA
jgi:hypothetical protein